MSEDANDVRGLDALVGEWSMEAIFPFDPPVTGRVFFEWLSEGSFLVQRWEVEHRDAPDGIAISSATTEKETKCITAPTLLIVGDSDAIRLEHVVEMFRILGGGVMGDLAGLPKSRLAVLPATSHFIPPGSGMLDRADLLAPMIGEFLDAPEEGG